MNSAAYRSQGKYRTASIGPGTDERPPSAGLRSRWLAMTLIVVIAVLLCAAGPSRTPAKPSSETIRSMMESAVLAARRGDFDDANETLRTVLAHEPRHERALRELDRLNENRSLATESEAFDLTRKLLPDSFRVFESKRFILLSDGSESWTRQQAELLERAHHQFNRFARRLDLRPLPLRHKLVGVLFSDRGEYQLFARTHDSVGDPWISGYYSPTNDRLVFYNVQTNPSVKTAHIKLGDMQREIAEIDRDIRSAERRGQRNHAESLRRMATHYRHHVATQEQRVEVFSTQVSIATTIHEAVHQLLFHTRVQSTHVQYPLWISEGLATAFETERPNEAFGPDHEYDPRREKFESWLESESLVPLHELVSMTAVSQANEDDVSVIYHQSYAFVQWMVRFRKKELRDYLFCMLEEPAGRPSPARHLELFEAAFGDVDRIERAWLRHERSRH